MIVWNKVTWYSQITAIILGIVIFVVGYSIGEEASCSDASDVQQITDINEYEPFKTESSPILIEVSEYGTALTFVFRDQESKEIIDTLRVSNKNIAAPTYQIVHGSIHDWLVVTRIDSSGTGYIKYVDDWYTLNYSVAEIVLSYVSKQTLAPNMSGYNNEYLNTRIAEVSSDNSVIRIDVTKKVCTDVHESSCSETTFTDTYQWNEESESFIINKLDVSKYSSVMPVSIGSQLHYEGSRVFYDRLEQKEKEVVAQKVTEVMSVQKDNDTVKVLIKETFTNDPEFTVREKSYILTETGFDFGTGKVFSFPLTLNQVLGEPDEERDDNLYTTYVSRVYREKILGNEHQCYDISSNTLGSTSLETFCEGVGYVRDFYEHHGTPDKSDYRLVSIGVDDID